MLPGKRFAFTLTEVLVTVAIMSVLVAAIAPAVATQVRKGEQSRVVTDAQTIRKGIEAFVADVRRYQSSLTQLWTAIGTGALDASGNTIPDQLVARWKGPYVSQTITGNLATAFDASILNAMVIRREAMPATSQSAAESPVGGSLQQYLTLQLTPFSYARCLEVNDLVDGTLAVPATPANSANWNRGQIHCRTSTTRDTLYFLLVPIQ